MEWPDIADDDWVKFRLVITLDVSTLAAKATTLLECLSLLPAGKSKKGKGDGRRRRVREAGAARLQRRRRRRLAGGRRWPRQARLQVLPLTFPLLPPVVGL